jgi:hypothetical protein
MLKYKYKKTMGNMLMSNLTPMKRLKNNIDTLKKNLKGFFVEDILNKSRKKYNPYGGKHDSGNYSKGVKSDFILLFMPIDTNINVKSIAIVFDYLNKD